MNLSNVNLNLLVNLNVLLDTCNVTRAAERLNISQSAMSKCLGQLREMFDDPLLVRVGNRLEPTPRAINLKERLNLWLNEAEVLLQAGEFEPARCESTFTLAVTDYVAQFILPAALKRIYHQAPHIGIRLINWDQHSLEGLVSGRIDLGTSSIDQPPANIYSQQIDEDTLVCVMSPLHPLTRKGLTLEGYIAFPHAVITSGGDKRRGVDKALASLGLSRRIGLEVPYYTSALNIVTGSQLLLTMPEHIARHTTEQLGLVQSPLPFETPTFTYSLIWHERHHQDASHRWLRRMLMAELRKSVFAH